MFETQFTPQLKKNEKRASALILLALATLVGSLCTLFVVKTLFVPSLSYSVKEIIACGMLFLAWLMVVIKKGK